MSALDKYYEKINTEHFLQFLESSTFQILIKSDFNKKCFILNLKMVDLSQVEFIMN